MRILKYVSTGSFEILFWNILVLAQLSILEILQKFWYKVRPKNVREQPIGNENQNKLPGSPSIGISHIVLFDPQKIRDMAAQKRFRSELYEKIYQKVVPYFS